MVSRSPGLLDAAPAVRAERAGTSIRWPAARAGAVGFICALPFPPTAIDVHNADWWYVKRMLEQGATRALVHKLLFYHN